MNTRQDLSTPPSTDPTALYRYRDGLYATDLLAAAISEFDFFTRFGDAPIQFADIAGKFDFKPRQLDVLLSLCMAQEFISQAGDSYSLTQLAKEHLVKGSRFFIGAYFASLKKRPVVQDMIKVLQTGRPAHWGGYEEDDWHDAMEDGSFAEEFTAAMDARGPLLGQALASKVDLSGRKRLLDIGGGSGIYACCLAAANPELRCSVLEKAPVDEIAKRYIAERGYSDVVGVEQGDLFKAALPEGYDVHLLSNVLHDWDYPEVDKIIQRCSDGLNSGGLLIAHEAFLNDDKAGPVPVIEYSCILMHSTQGRCYSLPDLMPYFEKHGFQFLERFDTAADRSALVFKKS